jgi:RNA methyltransferase, TrmH family
LSRARIKALVKLARSARAQQEERLALLDGPHLLEAFRQTGGHARVVVASESALARTETRQLFDAFAANTSDEHFVVAQDVFATLSAVENSVGLLAWIDVPAERALPKSIDDALLLDAVQEPGNVGALMRTAAAAGIRTILTTPGTARLWSSKVLRAAMGAHFGLSCFEDIDLATLRSQVPGALIATDLEATHDLYAVDLRGPTVWLFGNEGAGLSAQAQALATLSIRIPMPGATESLNVAAAAAVCLFEQVRQRRARS